MTQPKQNSLKDLIDFFGRGGRPVSPAEFRAFWESCTETEKEYYKNAPLS
jgi:hypothetical protein